MNESIKLINPTADIRIAGERPSAPWQESFLAGLPFLLNGLLMAAMYLVFIVAPPGSDSWQLNVVIVVSFLLSLAAVWVVLGARRRSWPTWVGSWIPFAIYALAYIIQLLEMVLPGDIPWQVNNGIFLILILSIVVSAAILFNRDRIASLLVTFYFFPVLGMMVIDPIPYWLGAVVCVCLGLLIGLAAAIAVRQERWLVAAGIGLAVNLTAGLLTLFIYSWGLQMLGFEALAFTDWLSVMVIYLFVTLVLMSAPVLIWGIFDWLKRLKLNRAAGAI